MAGGKFYKHSTKSKKKIQKVQIVKAPSSRRRTAKPLLGNSTKVKMRYTENIQVTPGAGGACGTYVFSANGLYDPNITGVGHQPRGFDQLMALYDHYCVIHSKITVIIAPNPALQVNAIIALRDSNTTKTAPTDYTEGRYAKETILMENSETKRMSMTFTPKTFLGVSHPLSEKDIIGDVSNNPSEQGFFHIALADMDAGATSALNIAVIIDYTAVLIEPKNPVAS